MTDPRDQPSEDVWDALARGELDEKELAALRVLAEDDPEIRVRLEAFAPVGPALQERVVERVLAQRARLRRGWVALSGAVAIAAAALLVFVSRPAPSGDLATGWSIAVSEGAREVRGTEPVASRARFLPETRIEIRLAPPTGTDAAPEIALFLVREGEVRTIDAPLERAPSGAVRIAGRAGEVLGDAPPGEWTLVVAVGARLPEREVLRAWARARDPRLLSVELELLPGEQR